MKHTETASARLARANEEVLTRLQALYLEAFAHDGFAEIRVEIRILRRGQKEVILHCGKQYRFVVDFKEPQAAAKLPAVPDVRLLEAESEPD